MRLLILPSLVRITFYPWPFVSDIAVFVLKRDVKLQLTNCGRKGIQHKNGGMMEVGHWLVRMRIVCLPLLSSLAPWSPEEDFFWHWLTRVVPKKGHKTVVCVCIACQCHWLVLRRCVLLCPVLCFCPSLSCPSLASPAFSTSLSRCSSCYQQCQTAEASSKYWP